MGNIFESLHIYTVPKSACNYDLPPPTIDLLRFPLLALSAPSLLSLLSAINWGHSTARSRDEPTSHTAPRAQLGPAHGRPRKSPCKYFQPHPKWNV